MIKKELNAHYQKLKQETMQQRDKIKTKKHGHKFET